MEEKQKARNKHLKMMAQMLTHNLRSPMAGLKMLFPLFNKAETANEKEELFQFLKDGSFELFEQIEDLSTVLIDYMELEKEKKTIDLEKFLNETEHKFSSETSAGCTIIHDFDDCQTLVFSIKYLEFIFHELLSNAMRFNSSKKDLNISVRSEKLEGKTIVEFSDNGVGIDLKTYELDLFKMYKTFHDMPSSEHKGIGHFRIKNMVEMMGGQVSLYTTKKGGLTFKIEFFD